jgi:protein involved in polysaccharide export with SLBB domain
MVFFIIWYAVSVNNKVFIPFVGMLLIKGSLTKKRGVK